MLNERVFKKKGFPINFINYIGENLKSSFWIDKFDVFLFDFDGLLVNTEELHFAAYKQMCKKRGCDLKWSFDQFCQIAHRDDTGLEKMIYAEFPTLYKEEPNWDILYAEKKQAYLEILQKSAPALLPGVESLLKLLAMRGKKRCIVTNASRLQLDLIEAKLPILRTIPVWVTRELYQRPKPAPDSYLHAINLLADQGDRIIGFEDSLKGIEALMQTKAEPILICHKTHPQLQDPLSKKVVHFPSLEQMGQYSPL